MWWLQAQRLHTDNVVFVQALEEYCLVAQELHHYLDIAEQTCSKLQHDKDAALIETG